MLEPTKKIPLRTQSLSYSRINSVRFYYLKDLFFQQNVESSHSASKETTSETYHNSKTHHNINLSNQSSKRPCHTSSLTTTGRGQGYTLVHVEKGTGTQFVRKKNNHQIGPKSSLYSSSSSYRVIVIHYES